MESAINQQYLYFLQSIVDEARDPFIHPTPRLPAHTVDTLYHRPDFKMPAPVEITFRPISKPTIGNNNYRMYLISSNR